MSLYVVRQMDLREKESNCHNKVATAKFQLQFLIDKIHKMKVGIQIR